MLKIGDETADVNIKKQQFIHDVNSDGSKKMKRSIKRRFT